MPRFHKLAMDHDCPVICVIHFNPGTDKSRGHLGSQLERKSETNLRLEKTNEITEIYSEKQRRAPIHKGEGICFRFDDTLQRHVTVMHPKEAAAFDLSNEHKALVEEIFAGKASMKHGELVEAIKAHAGCSRATANRRLENWIGQKLITKKDGLYFKVDQTKQVTHVEPADPF